MTELTAKLKKLKESQIQAKYDGHYLQGDNFIIEAQWPTLLQIVIDHDQAIEIVGDLTKYILSNMNTRFEGDL
jgi:hypothetical protein